MRVEVTRHDFPDQPSEVRIQQGTTVLALSIPDMDTLAWMILAACAWQDHMKLVAKDEDGTETTQQDPEIEAAQQRWSERFSEGPSDG